MTTTNNTGENFDIDALLDGTLDDLADFPEFKPYPAGTHKILGTFVMKEINKKKGYELKMAAVETIELSNPSDEPLSKGAETSVFYDLSNEYAQAAFKKLLAALAPSFPDAKSNRALIEEVKNLELLVVTTLRSGKGDSKDKQYTNVVEIAVA